MDRIFGTINGKWCIIFENRELRIKRNIWCCNSWLAEGKVLKVSFLYDIYVEN